MSAWKEDAILDDAVAVGETDGCPTEAHGMCAIICFVDEERHGVAVV